MLPAKMYAAAVSIFDHFLVRDASLRRDPANAATLTHIVHDIVDGVLDNGDFMEAVRVVFQAHRVGLLANYTTPTSQSGPLSAHQVRHPSWYIHACNLACAFVFPLLIHLSCRCLGHIASQFTHRPESRRGCACRLMLRQCWT